MNGRPLNRATFTKVENGLDAFASAKARGYVDNAADDGDKCKFVLCTGGEDDVCDEQCVSNGTTLEIP